jgi:anthranilate/para-aminobenzoate synthase component I
MAGEYARHVVAGEFDPTVLFRELVAPHDGGFWLDDSLGTTVSYLGVGTPIAVSDGFAELEWAGAFPVARVGWVSYDERERTLGVSIGLGRDPRAVVLDVSHAIEIDARDNEVAVIAHSDDEAFRDLIRQVESLSGIRGSELAATPPPRTAVWRDEPGAYGEAIERCLEHIRDGDAYQLCLTTGIDVAGDIDAPATYLALRAAAPTRYGAFIRASGVALLSASPESFLTVRGNRASTSPIKGTRPRSNDPAEDFVLRRELRESVKEQAENLMIVDLCRNDLSKVCLDGTVSVSALHEIETYSTVHQLVSTITGELRPDCTATDVARALFPAGSMTGAPKRSAVEILGRLETGERGMYSGVFGYAGAGNLTLAMTIRSIIVDADGAHIGVGGGITSGSIVADEITEVGIKAAAMLRVLGATPNPYLYTE